MILNRTLIDVTLASTEYVIYNVFHTFETL